MLFDISVIYYLAVQKRLDWLFFKQIRTNPKDSGFNAQFDTSWYEEELNVEIVWNLMKAFCVAMRKIKISSEDWNFKYVFASVGCYSGLCHMLLLWIIVFVESTTSIINVCPKKSLFDYFHMVTT